MDLVKDKTIYLTVTDHSVSKETFQLIYNNEFEMLETYPRPTPDELPRYYQSEDYISHTDSKRNLFEKVYQFVKSITLNRKLKLIESLATDSKKLLDFGCGTGDFLAKSKSGGWEVVGIEPNAQARKIANEKTGNCVFEAEKLSSLPDNSFDVITLWHVLEHLPNLEEQLSIFENLLSLEGTLIIAVPNFKSYDAEYYKSFWAGYDVPRHLWHFSKNAISKLADRTSMEVVKILPMKFDSYYVSLLSEKYKNGFMNPFVAFWIGWRSNMKAKSSNEYSSLIYIIKKGKKSILNSN